jgi:hypothetical protein
MNEDSIPPVEALNAIVAEGLLRLIEQDAGLLRAFEAAIERRNLQPKTNSSAIARTGGIDSDVLTPSTLQNDDKRLRRIREVLIDLATPDCEHRALREEILAHYQSTAPELVEKASAELPTIKGEIA